MPAYYSTTDEWHDRLAADGDHAPEPRWLSRASDQVVHLRSATDGLEIEGLMVPYSVWTEVRNSKEGHFFESFAPGALSQMKGRLSKIRALFEHGRDLLVGRMQIARLLRAWEEDNGAWYRARLLNGVPELIVEGLRAGVYGSSVRFEPVRVDVVRSPGRSPHNPAGIEERTVTEALVREVSIVTFPQYESASAVVVASAAGRSAEPARRPIKDYLADTPSWRLPDPAPPTWRL